MDSSPLRPAKPSLLAFAGLAGSRPQAFDGVSKNWKDWDPLLPPLSQFLSPADRVDRAGLARLIQNASSLDELADLGHQALSPAARQKATGDTDNCCATAWSLWVHAEWIVAAAPDAFPLLDPWRQTDGPATRPVFFAPPQEVAALQLRFAKDFLVSLIEPTEMPELIVSMRAFSERVQQDLVDWSKAHWPAPANAAPIPLNATRDRTFVMPSAEAIAVSGTQSSDNAMPSARPQNPHFARAQLLAREILGYGLFDKFPLSGTMLPSNESFETFCKNQAYFWTMEQKDTAQLELIAASARQLDALSGAVSVVGSATARSASPALPASDAVPLRAKSPAARASMDALPPIPTLGNMGAALADKFGLRAVTVSPFGGAKRAFDEIVRANQGFDALAAASDLPNRSIGLGGLALRLARSSYLTRTGARAFFLPVDPELQASHPHAAGDLGFTAPFQSLAHEWSHGWDFMLKDMVADRLTPAQNEIYARAHQSIKTSILFEEPASQKDRQNYLRRTSKAALADVLFKWKNSEDAMPFAPSQAVAQSPSSSSSAASVSSASESLLAALKAHGTDETHLRAKNGLLPVDFSKNLRAVWRAAKTGSESATASALAACLSTFVDPTRFAESGVSVEKAAERDAKRAIDVIQIYLNGVAIMKDKPNWGPMRWRSENMNLHAPDFGYLPTIDYWSRPTELLARSAEVFYLNPRTPELSLVPAHRFTFPQGDEAARAADAFRDFFADARPAFLAAQSVRPAESPLSLSQPQASADVLEWRPPVSLILRARNFAASVAPPGMDAANADGAEIAAQADKSNTGPTAAPAAQAIHDSERYPRAGDGAENTRLRALDIQPCAPPMERKSPFKRR